MGAPPGSRGSTLRTGDHCRATDRFSAASSVPSHPLAATSTRGPCNSIGEVSCELGNRGGGGHRRRRDPGFHRCARTVGSGVDVPVPRPPRLQQAITLGATGQASPTACNTVAGLLAAAALSIERSAHRSSIAAQIAAGGGGVQAASLLEARLRHECVNESVRASSPTSRLIEVEAPSELLMAAPRCSVHQQLARASSALQISRRPPLSS